MKKLNLARLGIAIVSALLLFTACKNNNEPAKENPNKSDVTQLTFTISAPQGEAFNFRDAAIHDQDEWNIKQLIMYTFDGDGTALKAIDEINIADLASTGDGTYTYTKEFDNTQVGNYRFLFVANDKVANAQVGMSLTNFEALLMTQQLTDDGTATSANLLKTIDGKQVIPMTGFAKQGTSTIVSIMGTTSPVKVYLTRVVARIDVSNHVPNLNITKISLLNTYNQASVSPTTDADGNKTYQAPQTAKQVNLSQGFATVPNPFKGIAGNEGNVLKKAFYLYEGQQPSTETDKDKVTTLIIEGQLNNGQQVVYHIPFVRASNNYIPVAVKRNFIYNVVLGDNNPLEPNSKLTFTIEDTPWNSIILNHELQIIRIDYYGMEYPSRHYDRLTNTFYTSSFSDEFHFRFTTPLAGHTKFTVKQIKSDYNVPFGIRNGDEAKEETVADFYIAIPNTNAYGQNNTETLKDTAVFEVYSDAAPEIKRYFTIVADKKYKNPNSNN